MSDPEWGSDYEDIPADEESRDLDFDDEESDDSYDSYDDYDDYADYDDYDDYDELDSDITLDN